MVMSFWATMQQVTQAVHDDSGSYGAEQDVDDVQAFLAAANPDTAPSHIPVAGIPLPHFYAYNTGALDKDRLWDRISQETGKSGVTQPAGWETWMIYKVTTYFA
jgi:hypothetical protein